MAKKIRENGIVLSKVIKPATEAFKGSDGREVPAYPERHVVTVACGEVDGENGIQDVLLARVTVEKEQYNELKFMDNVDIGYEYKGENKIKNAEIFGKVKGSK